MSLLTECDIRAPAPALDASRARDVTYVRNVLYVTNEDIYISRNVRRNERA